MNQIPCESEGGYLKNDIVVPCYRYELLPPQETPKEIVFEFTKRGEGWPPQPRGQQDIQRVSAREIPGSLTPELEREILLSAQEHPKVKEMLGERFAYISTSPLNVSKKGVSDCSTALKSRMTFFSYSQNSAVEVAMVGMAVQEVSLKPGYQPSEGLSEIEEAICLARADSRIKDNVALLSANAILLPIGDENVGGSQRIMWVIFTDPMETEDEKPSLFTAAVDLISQSVIMARQEPLSYSQKGESYHA